MYNDTTSLNSIEEDKNQEDLLHESKFSYHDDEEEKTVDGF
jgi:hypothetical protein